MEEFDALLEKIQGKVRLQKGQNFSPNLGDSPSVRWGNNRSLNGIDGNKKIKGIKRHVVVDKNGFWIAVMVTMANIHDSQAALLLMRILKSFLSSVKIILADGGYRGDLVAEAKKKIGYLLKITLRTDKPKKSFEPIPKGGLLREPLLGLTMTEECVAITNY